MKLLRFLIMAFRTKNAYIDMDGCLLHRMPIPAHVTPAEALDYWMANLCETRLIKRRLVLLYVLRAMGVQLHLWTNRSPQHEPVTRGSFGRHYRLFSSHHYGAGQKRHHPRCGPCMDDEEKNVGAYPGDLLVKAPPHGRDLLTLWTPPEEKDLK